MWSSEENEEAGRDVPVPMDEDQRVIDAQVETRDKPEARALPLDGPTNLTPKGVAMRQADNMNVETDLLSRAVAEPEKQNSLDSVPVQDEAQTLLQTDRGIAQGSENMDVVVNAADETTRADKANQAIEVKKADEIVEVNKNGEVDQANEVPKDKDCLETNKTHALTWAHYAHDTKQSSEVNGVNEARQTGETIEVKQSFQSDLTVQNDTAKPVAADVEMVVSEEPEGKVKPDGHSVPKSIDDPSATEAVPSDVKDDKENGVEAKDDIVKNEKKAIINVGHENEHCSVHSEDDKKYVVSPAENESSGLKHWFLDDDHDYDGNESGTEEEQSAFMKELANFFREKSLEFKPPKFYGEGLNCLKLWRAVMRLGGYDKVTSCKLWRQVGESFKPPKTCTTVSWTFRGFYEKALLDYERHMTQDGEAAVPIASHSQPASNEHQTPGSGRARRDAAARAMQGWHSQRLLGNGEVSDPIIKDKSSISMQKRERQLKSFNLAKRKKPPYLGNEVKAARSKPSKPQLDSAVVDIGLPADWVKINVQRTKDCFEVYALVPGLLREEVRVQSDPAGRLVISGEPEDPDNPWGVTPFKKVVTLPSRVDPSQTSAVVTLHGQLFVRVPFEQSE